MCQQCPSDGQLKERGREGERERGREGERERGREGERERGREELASYHQDYICTQNHIHSHV